jgi:hypothetical protein
MKYLKLFESWNTVSAEELASAQELNLIGVVSDQELRELQRLRQIEQRIINYTGVGNLNLTNCTLLKSLPNGLKVGGHLILNGCNGLESLPDDLEVKGYLNLSGCIRLESLPAGLTVGRDLYLYGCTSLAELPQDQKNLKVGGQILR